MLLMLTTANGAKPITTVLLLHKTIAATKIAAREHDAPVMVAILRLRLFVDVDNDVACDGKQWWLVMKDSLPNVQNRISLFDASSCR
jgi:hypothetical protein